jgi:hypothetical protein
VYKASLKNIRKLKKTLHTIWSQCNKTRTQQKAAAANTQTILKQLGAEQHIGQW